MQTSRLRSLVALVCVSVGSSACTRARITGGGAFSAADLDGHSGILAGTDIAIGWNHIPWAFVPKDTPIAFHVMGEALLAPQVTDLSWGTGLGYVRRAEPIAGYGLIGTSFHVDRIEGRYSVGSLSPYLELGVAAALDPNSTAQTRAVLTLGLASMVYFNFLLPSERAVTSYYGLKFGVGFDGM
jgi:hypothetical protein